MTATLDSVIVTKQVLKEERLPHRPKEEARAMTWYIKNVIERVKDIDAHRLVTHREQNEVNLSCGVGSTARARIEAENAAINKELARRRELDSHSLIREEATRRELDRQLLPKVEDLAAYIVGWLRERNGAQLGPALSAMSVEDYGLLHDELAYILKHGGHPPNWVPIKARTTHKPDRRGSKPDKRQTKRRQDDKTKARLKRP